MVRDLRDVGPQQQGSKRGGERPEQNRGGVRAQLRSVVVADGHREESVGYFCPVVHHEDLRPADRSSALWELNNVDG